MTEKRVQTVCLLIVTTVAIGAALRFLGPVLIPFVLALFLVYCLAPAIDAQVRYLGIRRSLAVTSTVVLGVILLFLTWLLIWASVGQLTENAQEYTQQFRQLITNVASRLPLEHFGIDSQDLTSVVQISQETTRGLLAGLASSIIDVLSNALLVVIFMIFIVVGRRRSAPAPDSLRGQIDARVHRYILTKVLVSAATGILVGATLWILDVELAMVFGLLAFMLNFIPSIGSVIATLLPLPVVVLSPEMGPVAKVLAIAVPGVIQFAVGNLLEPKIMGHSLDLHPVVVLLGLIFFGMIWGIIGMILATPIVAVTKIVLERIELTAPAARLLAGRFEEGTPE